jgi:hypothetical protein
MRLYIYIYILLDQRLLQPALQKLGKLALLLLLELLLLDRLNQLNALLPSAPFPLPMMLRLWVGYNRSVSLSLIDAFTIDRV